MTGNLKEAGDLRPDARPSKAAAEELGKPLKASFERVALICRLKRDVIPWMGELIVEECGLFEYNERSVTLSSLLNCSPPLFTFCSGR